MVEDREGILQEIREVRKKSKKKEDKFLILMAAFVVVNNRGIPRSALPIGNLRTKELQRFIYLASVITDKNKSHRNPNAHFNNEW